MAKISTKKDDKLLLNLNRSMNLLDEAINLEKDENVAPYVISKNFAHCIRAEVMDTYRDEGKSPPDKYEIKDSGDDWRECTDTIALTQGVLRPYEAGWWTQARPPS
jgi:hypothetical protein